MTSVDSGASYAGDILAPQAWEILSQDPQAMLVDVRTHPEWVYVGVPDVAALGRKLVTVSWLHYPMMMRNGTFLEDLRDAGVRPDATVVLICRSGVRSRSAAQYLTANGFATCYNVADGFEGQIDAEKHRGVGGWRALGLPWQQS